MLTRLSLVAVALLFATGIAAAQPYFDPSLPEPCRETVKEDMKKLTQRQQRLERDVASKRAELGLKGDAQPSPSDPRAKSLRDRQAELLQVLFKIECLNAQLKLQPDQVTTRAPRRETRPPPAPSPKLGAEGGMVEVTTYFATNRNLIGGAEPDKVYGGKADSLRYGRAVVSIPLTHSPGSIELPSLWKLERTTDPNRHFVLKSVDPLGSDAARKEMASRLQASGSKALLVFVHGYYTGFREAALRTAQLAHDLKFTGVPFFFSWPSAGRFLAYFQDTEAAQLSETAFEQMLEDLSKLPADDIYIIAHSMGNRIVTQALRARVEKGKDNFRLRELLLAAPDINADLFRTVIAPKLTAMRGTRTTVYAASSDLALRASKAMHGFQRVGETASGVFIFPGLETIDASSGALITRGYGHSYLMDSPSVLEDIRALIRQRVSARQRGLPEVGTAPNTFWKLP
jgi:esterase/lipase superfamily enzyme